MQINTSDNNLNNSSKNGNKNLTTTPKSAISTPKSFKAISNTIASRFWNFRRNSNRNVFCRRKSRGGKSGSKSRSRSPIKKNLNAETKANTKTNAEMNSKYEHRHNVDPEHQDENDCDDDMAATTIVTKPP